MTDYTSDLIVTAAEYRAAAAELRERVRQELHIPRGRRFRIASEAYLLQTRHRPGDRWVIVCRGFSDGADYMTLAQTADHAPDYRLVIRIPD